MAIFLALWQLVSITPAAPVPSPRKPTVEVVFCLDTTGSMSGLLEGAKNKVWSICNQILNGRPMPNLKVGLVAFRDKGDDYVTKVYDLRDDLDDVYTELQTFAANGGGDTPEHVNQALDDSINKITWSKDKRTVKIVFLVGDAAPHMDYNDDVKYPDTCKKAQDLGIIINAIQCGNDTECTKAWKDICEKGGGAYAAIPQDGGSSKKIATEFDKRLSEINTELAKRIIPFGDATKREATAKRIKAVETLAGEIAADRAGYMAKEGRVARFDLLDAIRAGTVRLENLKDEELPMNLQKLTLKQKETELDKLGTERSKLLREAANLDRQRSAAILKELEKDKNSFDGQVFEMLRKQSSRLIRY
jgi:Mg-chelatase subunit ChlD